jgi:hypothetical protein
MRWKVGPLMHESFYMIGLSNVLFITAIIIRHIRAVDSTVLDTTLDTAIDSQIAVSREYVQASHDRRIVLTQGEFIGSRSTDAKL